MPSSVESGFFWNQEWNTAYETFGEVNAEHGYTLVNRIGRAIAEMMTFEDGYGRLPKTTINDGGIRTPLNVENGFHLGS